MEDADDFKVMGLDPIECLELLLRIHPKPHWTLGLVLDQQNYLNPIVFPCQQPAGFQRCLGLDILKHRLPMFGFES